MTLETVSPHRSARMADIGELYVHERHASGETIPANARQESQLARCHAQCLVSLHSGFCVAQKFLVVSENRFCKAWKTDSRSGLTISIKTTWHVDSAERQHGVWMYYGV